MGFCFWARCIFFRLVKQMNVYDFDGTIYKGDSTVDFYLFCIRRHPLLLRYIFHQGMGVLFYRFGRIGKTQMKEYFFTFLKGIREPEKEIQQFWKKNGQKMESWYLKQRKEEDLVISASPAFLLAPICEQVGIRHLIASEVDLHTGKFQGKNCRGEEKVRRFREKFPDGKIQEFYSDSHSDAPLAGIAEKAFLVQKSQLKKW